MNNEIKVFKGIDIFKLEKISNEYAEQNTMVPISVATLQDEGEYILVVLYEPKYTLDV